MNVTITESAWDDMLNIGRAIMQDSPTRAGTFVDELHESCESLGQSPRSFPLLPGYEDKGIHRRVHGNYLIFYRIADSGVEVLHGARDYETLLFGEGLHKSGPIMSAAIAASQKQRKRAK